MVRDQGKRANKARKAKRPGRKSCFRLALFSPAETRSGFPIHRAFAHSGSRLSLLHAVRMSWTY